jgi:NAD-dependent dihydropyrimidine dehydrogenase PreA subunit
MRKQNRLETVYIQIYTRNCKACWNCVETCPKKVFGKIDIIFHKHARIDNSKECIGCLKCVKACEYVAIIPIDKKLN